MDAQTRPTLIDGLTRRAMPAEQRRMLARAASSARGSALDATCADCGTAHSGWRQLLGIGAELHAASGDAGKMIVRCPGACVMCGGEELVITSR